MWARSSRRERLRTASLLGRLEALEASTNFARPAVTTRRVGPGAVGDARSLGLVGWFGIGFACACLGGAVALLALLLVRPAQAEQSFSARSRVEQSSSLACREDGGFGAANERTPSATGNPPRLALPPGWTIDTRLMGTTAHK